MLQTNTGAVLRLEEVFLLVQPVSRREISLHQAGRTLAPREFERLTLASLDGGSQQEFPMS